MEARYLKPVTSTYAPRAWMSVIVDTDTSREMADGKQCEITFRRVTCAYSSRKEHKWSEPRYEVFDDHAKFHDYVERILPLGRRLHVVAPVASDALTLTGFWERVDAVGCRRQPLGRGKRSSLSREKPSSDYLFEKTVWMGIPDVIHYRIGHSSIIWTSGKQYFTANEEELARCIGYRYPHSGMPVGGGVSVSRTASERAGLWLSLFQNLSDWWTRIDGGPWGDTVGRLSVNFFRRTLQPGKILIHEDENATKLENAGLFGGRSSLWYTGTISPPENVAGDAHREISADSRHEITGPIEQWDIRSMYPHLLATHGFPVRLLSVRRGRTVGAVRELCRTCGVIARVRVDTRCLELPSRTAEGVWYKRGVYWTTLCGPELEYAIDRGDVIAVEDTAVYAMDRPFKDMAGKLLKLRFEYRKGGLQGMELFVKLLSNSFAGKLAQRSSEWAERHHVRAALRWGSWVDSSARTGETRRFKAIAGMVWEHVRPEEPSRPMGAAFDYLTAYGRTAMRLIREKLPPRCVIQQDTDGLWVLPELVTPEVRSSLPFGDQPGQLRVVRRANWGRFWSPKHYVVDGEWTLAGIRSTADWSGGAKFRDTYTVNPISGAPREAPRSVWFRTADKTLSLTDHLGELDPDGWVYS
jgi:hypothetical protein